MIRKADGTTVRQTIEHPSRYSLSTNRIIGWAHVRDYTETDFDTTIKPIVYEDCDGIGATVHTMLHGNHNEYDQMFLKFRVMFFEVEVPTELAHILSEPLVVWSFLEDAYTDTHERAHEKAEYLNESNEFARGNHSPRSVAEGDGTPALKHPEKPGMLPPLKISRLVRD